MSNTDKITILPNKLKVSGRSYLDAKMANVYNTLDELQKVSKLKRFQGLSAIVLDDDSEFCPCEYWIPKDDLNWVKKNSPKSFRLVLDDEKNILQLEYLTGKNSKGDDVYSLVSDIKISTLTNDGLVKNIELVNKNDNQEEGSFLKITYVKDEDKDETSDRVEYVKLSEALSQSYTPGNGIKIENNKISVDEEWLSTGSTLSSQISSIAEKASGNTETIQNLSDTISNIAGTVSGHTGDIETINNNLEEIKATVSGNSDNIIAIKSDLTEINSTVSGHTSDIENLSSRIDNLSTAGVVIDSDETNLLKNGKNGLGVFIEYSKEDEELNNALNKL